MIRLLRWFLGYIEFEFVGGFAEGLINTCYEYGIGIFDIRRSNDIITACCPVNKYKMLHKAARINGGKIKSIRKKGIIFPLLKIKNRWGLMVGAVVFILIINALGGFVWDIRFEGNESISNEEIMTVLDENDFRVGTYWDSINKSSLEAMLMASLNQCAWVSINQEGCTAVIEIDEAKPKPEIVEDKITNLRAKKDGIIVSAVTYEGWPVVKAGEGVAKGDLLISGIYEGETTKVTLFAHARGEYIAQVTEKIDLTVNRQQKEKVYTGEKSYKSICFFGLTIPIYLGNYTSVNADIEKEYKYAELNDKTLPIGILTTTVKSYQVNEKILNDRELTRLAKKKIEAYINTQLKDYEVINDSSVITINEGNAKISGKIICLENIGEETEIPIKKSKNSNNKNYDNS